MRRAEFEKKLYWSERVWGKTKCWTWFPSEINEHAERICIGGRRLLVHRYLYLLLRERGHELAGPLKKNQPLVHTCDYSGCLSPHHHMPALSQKAIAEQGDWSGTAPNDPRGAHNRRKSRCPHGHPYTVENTKWTTDGRRQCRTCHREGEWRYWAPREWITGGRGIIRVPGEPLPFDAQHDDDETADLGDDFCAELCRDMGAVNESATERILT